MIAKFGGEFLKRRKFVTQVVVTKGVLTCGIHRANSIKVIYC